MKVEVETTCPICEKKHLVGMSENGARAGGGAIKIYIANIICDDCAAMIRELISREKGDA